MTAWPKWLRDLQMHGTAMRTLRERSASRRSYSRHCEERSDEAIQGPHHRRLRPLGAPRVAALDCFVARAPRNDGAADVATRPTNAWNRYADFALAIGFRPILFSSLRGAK